MPNPSRMLPSTHHEVPHRHGEEDSSRLHPHPRHDQAPRPHRSLRGPVATCRGAQTAGYEDAYSTHAEAEVREEQGKDAPAHAVVEVVDEPCLGAGEEVAVPVGTLREDLSERQGLSAPAVLLHLQADVLACIAHEERGD